MEHPTTIAVDLAKSVFEVAVSTEAGRVCHRSRGFGPNGRNGKVKFMAEVKEILDEALKLDPEDRASVAVELLESLEAAPQEQGEVEAAWAAEIERRARRVLSGKSGAPWEEVRRKVEANLTKR